MNGNNPELDVVFLKAKIAIQDGRIDEGINELRLAIHKSSGLEKKFGRENVERILHFAKENDIYNEVDSLLDDGDLRERFWGD